MEGVRGGEKAKEREVGSKIENAIDRMTCDS